MLYRRVFHRKISTLIIDDYGMMIQIRYVNNQLQAVSTYSSICAFKMILGFNRIK